MNGEQRASQADVQTMTARRPRNRVSRVLMGAVHYLLFVPCRIVIVLLNLLETSACLWVIMSCMPLILISPTLYRKVTDFVVEEFCRFSVQLFSITASVKLRVSGEDLAACKEESWPIFLWNHKTQLDMLPAWLLLYKYSLPCTLVKFMAASYTRYLPAWGCGLQVMRSIFLTRSSKERDVQQIRDVIGYHTFYNMPKGVLMYPEGTTAFSGSLAATNRFAEKRGLPGKQYCLYPRHAGLYELLRTLSSHGLLDNNQHVYDVTLAYEEYRSSDTDYTISRIILHEPIQRHIHVHVAKYRAADLAKLSEEELRQFLYKIYEEKEQRLKAFDSPTNPCLNFGNSAATLDASLTTMETLSGVARIVSHLFVVLAMFVLPWYYVRLYKLDEYAGLAGFPAALMLLTVMGELVGLDRMETWLSKFHLFLICWPVQVKLKNGGGGFFSQQQQDLGDGGNNMAVRMSNVLPRLSSRLQSFTNRHASGNSPDHKPPVVVVLRATSSPPTELTIGGGDRIILAASPDPSILNARRPSEELV